MANRQTLKDALHHVIGYIDTASDGRQTLLDAKFHKVGYYDPKSNTTKDARFHPVGSGNLLTSLLSRK